MRFSMIAPLLFLIGPLVSANPAPGPAPTPASAGAAAVLARRQVSRAEISARANHPDLFKRDGVIGTVAPVPSGCSVVNPAGGAGGGETITLTLTTIMSPADTNVAGTERRRYQQRQKQQKPHRYEQEIEVKRVVLGPEDMASFLIGHGTFNFANGTTYSDPHYAAILKERASNQPSYAQRFGTLITDAFGNQLLQASLPYYKKWKNALTDEDTLHLSAQTIMPAREYAALEQIMLARSDWDTLQVHGYRVDRRFLEVANSY